MRTSKFRFTAETQRSLREFLLIRSGDGDRIRNSRLPTRGFGRQAFGDKFNVAFHRYGATTNACVAIKEGFLFGGLSPPNKKSLLRALRASAVKILFWTSLMLRRFTFD